MLKYCTLIICFLILLSCKVNHKVSVYSNPIQYLTIYPLQNSDTFLILQSYPRSNLLYSFHSIDSMENRYLLKNINDKTPKVELISAKKDTVLSIYLVDESNNDLIYNINPFIHINDSVKSWYSDHEVNFNVFYKDKFDSIQSLQFMFLEGFNYEINNLPVGKLIFQIKNYKGDTGSRHIRPYYKNYYLSSPTINEGFIKFEGDSTELFRWRNDSTKFLFERKSEFSQKEIKSLKKEIGKHNFPNK